MNRFKGIQTARYINTGWPTGTWHLLNGYVGRGWEGGERGGRHSFPLGWPLSTKWCHSAHCKRVNDHCSKHVSRAPHFPFRRRAVIPCSPDLSTCDFFVWGYLKSHVYTHKPRTLNDLKEAILQEIRPIDRQLLARVMEDFKKRLENCIQEDGRRLTDIIFKT